MRGEPTDPGVPKPNPEGDETKRRERREAKHGPRYEFVQLDPRPDTENPDYDLGIEVTDPRLLKPGVLNLDHHGEGMTAEDPAACEQALDVAIPPDGAVFATVRPDADSVTAMAVLRIRASEKAFDIDLVRAVGLMDRYGPRMIDHNESVKRYRNKTIAIARVAADHTLLLEERVQFVEQCLDGTVDPVRIKGLVDARDREYTEARKELTVTEVVPEKLVFVEGTHRFATSVGYEHASTVIAYNPEMPILERQDDGSMQPTGETYGKYTVCRYDNNVSTDLEAALQELQGREEGWGGRGDIFGSPQNQETKLTKDDIVKIVTKHIEF